MVPDDPFGHELPTEAEAIAALREQIGDELAEGLWALSARELGLARPISTAPDLLSITEHLMDVSDLARVTARSLKVRTAAYTTLVGSGDLR